MVQFIVFAIIFGVVIIDHKVDVARSKAYLENKYNEASVTGNRDAARWYIERLSHLK